MSHASSARTCAGDASLAGDQPAGAVFLRMSQALAQRVDPSVLSLTQCPCQDRFAGLVASAGIAPVVLLAQNHRLLARITRSQSRARAAYQGMRIAKSQTNQPLAGICRGPASLGTSMLAWKPLQTSCGPKQQPARLDDPVRPVDVPCAAGGALACGPGVSRVWAGSNATPATLCSYPPGRGPKPPSETSVMGHSGLWRAAASQSVGAALVHSGEGIDRCGPSLPTWEAFGTVSAQLALYLHPARYRANCRIPLPEPIEPCRRGNPMI